MAPTPLRAAISAPVKARPPLAATVGEIEPVTTIVVLAESPVAPVATIWCVPGVVSDGMTTVVEKAPVASAVVVPRATGVLCRVRVIVSLGTKFEPVTTSDPPGAVEDVFDVRAGAFGP